MGNKEKYDMELMGGVLKGCLSAIAFWLALIFLILMFASCKSVKYVPVIEHHTDTCYITKWMWDSIYVQDSTHIVEKNDTIKIEKWHTKYKEKQVHDTTYVATHDTIPQPYPVEVKVEKELNWWQKFSMRFGWIALAVLFGFVGWKLFKLWRFFHP